MPKATKDQMVVLFDQFLTDHNMWDEFKKHTFEHGYRLADLGFIDTEEDFQSDLLQSDEL